MIPTLLLAAHAVAGPAPCTPIDVPDYIEGEHFWVSWEPAVGDAEIAAQTLAWAEEAWSVYTAELGYDWIDRPVLIRIQESFQNAGLTTTTECTHGPIVPLITLFSTTPGRPGQNTTMHEVVHAVQYAYMGAYTESITSWPWWMEGCASWTTTWADDDLHQWGYDARGYLDAPWVGLHQTPLAYGDPVLSRFLYGTGVIVQELADAHGPETVRATWEYGALESGAPIYFPDALTRIGVDFESFWANHMAAMTVVDIGNGEAIDAPIAVSKHVANLPADGGPKEAEQPQGLGLSVVHFKKVAGESGHDLRVTFDGDPTVPWIAVLARTRGSDVGGKVKEVLPFEVVDGHGVGVLPAFDGALDGWLIVSPQDATLTPRDYSWHAELVSAVAATEEPARGCDTASAVVPWWLLGALALVACGRREPAGTDGPLHTGWSTTFTVPTGHYPLDDVLRFDHVQARGTHNSYHVAPETPVDPSHAYTHASITDQLALQGVRQFELDLHLREDGAIEVFHIPAIDAVSTCPLFTDCLSEMKTWSNANPLHTPIVVWMELKDDVDALAVGYQTFDGGIDGVEDAILSVLPRFRVLTPDEVRGSRDTLPEAIVEDGWPTLGALRGRFVFALLESGAHRDAYLAGRENLAGALLFADADAETDPWAATFKIDDARSDQARIQGLVAQGFMVTSNADGADNDPVDNADRRDASLASGAQFLSSDRPAPDSGTDGYWLEIPGGQPARCNPISAPPECTAADVESLPG